MANILQICRLKTPEDQIEIAKKADQEGWTVKELKAAVDKKVKPSPQPSPEKGEGVANRPSPSSGEGARRAGEGETDPFAEVWSEAKKDAFMLRCGDWAAAYGSHGQLAIPPSELSPAAKGWLFWIEEESQTPKKMLAQWFGLLAERLGYDPSKKESIHGE